MIGNALILMIVKVHVRYYQRDPHRASTMNNSERNGDLEAGSDSTRTATDAAASASVSFDVNTAMNGPSAFSYNQMSDASPDATHADNGSSSL